MKLVKDGVERIFNDVDTIEIFKNAGWEEVKEVQENKETMKTETKKPTTPKKRKK